MDCGNVNGAVSTAHKATTTAEIDVTTRNMCHATFALESLLDGKYDESCTHWLAMEVGTDMYPFCAEDVATYGLLCAMATCSTHKVKTAILQSQTFKRFFENVPDLRQLAMYFVENKFGDCLALLLKLRQFFDVDMYLAPHVNALISLILEKLIINYCMPYDMVSLVDMSRCFQISLGDMEKLALYLIKKKAIPNRMDMKAKTLHKLATNPKSELFANVVNLANQHKYDMVSGIMRCSLHANYFVIKSESESRKYDAYGFDGPGGPGGGAHAGPGFDSNEGELEPMEDMDGNI